LLQALIRSKNEVLMMDVSGISSPAATTSSSQTKGTTVAIEVFKKSLEVEQQQISDLLTSLPDPDSPVGQNINIKV